MTTVRCDFYAIYRRLVSALNAGVASTFTTVLDDPRRSPGELFASIQAADDEVSSLLASIEGQGHRPLFLTDTADLSHGDTLPDRLGNLTQVKIKYLQADSDYKAGKTDRNLSLADIERWRANVGTIYDANTVLGFYRELGDEVFFTGYRAKAKYASYTKLSRDVTDGAMSSSGKILTSLTAVFTADDVGAGLLIEDARSAGVPLVTRLDLFSISTQVGTRDAAGATVTGKTVTIAKLQSPQEMEDFVFSIAMTNQVKRGDTVPFAEIYTSAANNYRQMVRGGAVVIPPIEMAQAA
jgi:hypothetical protein